MHPHLVRAARVAARRATLVLLILVAASGTSLAQSGADSATVAPGVRVPARLVGASRAVIDSLDVARSAAITLSELLQARAAGVGVMMSGGTLTDGGRVLMRGPSTIETAGAPMLIVDGMRMADREDDSTTTASRLDDIALDDVASVEILRGPAAAALYGGGAPSGVIVVTTKRGTARGWHVDGRAFADARRLAHDFPLRYQGFGLFGTNTTPTAGCSLVIVASGGCTRTSLVVSDPLGDASVLRTGAGGRASLGVSAGTSTGAMRLSATGRQANGIGPDERLSQLFTRFNATQRIGFGFDVGAHASWLEGTSRGTSLGEVIGQGLSRPPQSDTRSNFTDDVATAYASPSDERQKHLTVGGELGWQPLSWLVVRGAMSRDRNEARASRRLDPSKLYFSFGAPFAYRSDRSDGTIRASRATLEVTHPVPGIDGASGRLVVGAERTVRSRDHSDSLFNTPSGSVSYISWSLASGVNVAEFLSERIAVGERFVLGAGVRRERDTRADSAFRLYPSGDVAWGTPWAPAGGALRLRAAYGEAAQPFSLFELFVPPGYAPFGPTGPGTVDIPERMRELELGADLEWGGRASVATTLYRRQVPNALAAVPSPLLGAGLPITREIDVRGVEIDARAAVLDRAAWRWELRGIAAALRSRLRGDYLIYGPGVSVGQDGSPLWGVSSTAPSYADANGDGLLTYGEMTQRQPTTDLRPTTPTFQGALHSTLTWRKRLTLLAIVDRYAGHYAVPGSEIQYCGQPNCREGQDPASTLAEQAYALDLLSGRAFGDASFTRLREVSVRWSFPSDARGVLRGATFVVAGRDLATWSGWRGLDPEINTNRRSMLLQSDANGVPLPRRLTVGVEIGGP